MGRGGARSKASGGTMSQESPLINQPLSLNMTLFQFLRTGYFEKDLLSYCANAIAEYSCIYWLDPTVENDSEGVELPTVAQNIDTVSFSPYSKHC
ncbi:unnamed protein product [Calicophoron daubneyi]|uniref:Uncharacterized protein n=1 Tax=Calicophoron daubneyi TaxID=300641 RepID=A0AAV2TPL2_CALDB